MRLIAAPHADEISEVISRLRRMSLAYEFISDEKVDQPLLTDGNVTHRGLRQILSFLDELESELKSWYYCDC